MLNRHWFIDSSPSAGEIQGWDSQYCKTLEVWCTDTWATLQRLSLGPGWLLQKPSLLFTWLLEGKFTGSQAQATSTGRSCSMPEQQDFRHPRAWNIQCDASRFCLHLPPIPQGWSQQLWLDWLELILHSGIFASSSPEPAKCQQWFQTGQAGNPLPSTSFY